METSDRSRPRPTFITLNKLDIFQEGQVARKIALPKMLHEKAAMVAKASAADHSNLRNCKADDIQYLHG